MGQHDIRRHFGDPGVESLATATARAAPATWTSTKAGADEGLMPAKVSGSVRPTVTAGLAKEVDDVAK